MNYKKQLFFSLSLLLSIAVGSALAHGVDDKTRSFLIGNEGAAFVPFLYIGAKHMITGYDHILFLVGVIFFLYKPKDILIYVSFFTIGHSLTLLLGVLANISINAYLIDAIIAFSIVYKGFDNLGGFQKLFGFQPNTKATVLVFGLFHGFGLASKLQDFKFAKEGLLTNLIGFNIGVEIGQFLALILVLLIISAWRYSESFKRFSTLANTLLMAAGFLLIGYQLTGYFTQ
ncbi:HupE/UreJ family protein [Dyadobacter psychrotolerans]|uniref:HupE/UreJ family protein n=1 Tax=Dyadobacter psychrotolerans TaxID=2541721 RepID=A0A4R5DKX0_9BACT|nr:HupE/UreJ family protein [Dyadobacter psychrotolerans]TDE14719.1 HupE/UreJ family protein [Dyadobacter psychrotolerans]